MLKKSALHPQDIQGRIFAGENNDNRTLVNDQLVLLLYEMNSQIFDLQKRLEIHAAVFRAQNFRIDDDQQGLLSFNMPRRVEIDAQDAVESFGGLYHLEYSRDHAFRWTGPGPSLSLNAWIDRSLPVMMHISLISYGQQSNRGAIKLLVDGTEVGLHFAEGEFWSDLFPCHIEMVRTHLEVVIPHHSSQQDRNDDDPRDLGIAFKKITLSSSLA